MRKRTTLLGAALAGLAGLLGASMITLGGGGAATAAQAAAVPIKVVTWNICGEYNGCPKTATAAEVNGKRTTRRPPTTCRRRPRSGPAPTSCSASARARRRPPPAARCASASATSPRTT